MTTIESLQKQVSKLSAMLGITPEPEPVIIEPDERKRLVAELAKIRADRDAEATKQLSAIAKAREEWDQSLQQLREAGARQEQTNRAYSESGWTFEKKQRDIVTRLMVWQPALFEGFRRTIKAQREAMVHDYGLIREISTKTAASFSARFDALGALDVTVGTWYELSDSDADMKARFQKELAKIPPFVPDLKPEPDTTPRPTATAWGSLK